MGNKLGIENDFNNVNPPGDGWVQMGVLDFLNSVEMHRPEGFKGEILPLVNSKGDARRRIQGNSIVIDHVKITSPDHKLWIWENCEGLEAMTVNEWFSNARNGNWWDPEDDHEKTLYNLVSKYGGAPLKCNEVLSILVQKFYFVKKGKRPSDFYLVKVL